MQVAAMAPASLHAAGQIRGGGAKGRMGLAGLEIADVLAEEYIPTDAERDEFFQMRAGRRARTAAASSCGPARRIAARAAK